jgi:predicted PurR-regulated permease PerM
MKMLGIDHRALRVFWTLFVFGLLLFVIYKIAGTLTVFVLALFLSELLAPLVDFVERFLPRRIRRVLAIVLVYLALTGIVVAIAIPIGSNIAQQAVVLANRLPRAVQSNPLEHIPLPYWLEPQRETLTLYFSDRVQDLGSIVLPSLGRAGSRILTGLGSVLSAVLVPIIGFIFLIGGAELRREFVNLFDLDSRRTVDGILDDMQYLISHYIRALILLSAATFVSFSTFLSLLHAPYAILLAGVASALEVIPVLGPLTAAVSIVVVAALSGYAHILWLVIFLTLYRILQDYLFSPYLMGTGVQLHPLWVLFGVLAGDQLAGIPGMFFSVPVIAALRMLLMRMRRSNVR